MLRHFQIGSRWEFILHCAVFVSLLPEITDLYENQMLYVYDTDITNLTTMLFNPDIVNIVFGPWVRQERLVH